MKPFKFLAFCVVDALLLVGALVYAQTTTVAPVKAGAYVAYLGDATTTKNTNQIYLFGVLVNGVPSMINHDKLLTPANAATYTFNGSYTLYNPCPTCFWDAGHSRIYDSLSYQKSQWIVPWGLGYTNAPTTNAP